MTSLIVSTLAFMVILGVLVVWIINERKSAKVEDDGNTEKIKNDG
jgi:uncharacterized Tic20 family protein